MKVKLYATDEETFLNWVEVIDKDFAPVEYHPNVEYILTVFKDGSLHILVKSEDKNIWVRSVYDNN